MMKWKNLVLIVLLVVHFQPIWLQPRQQMNASQIYHHLQKLNVLGSALYIAAHPDDENTRLITWLANEKKVETAYVSLTRGDGGQNLIGKELGFGLGYIRTNELLKARATDGAHQFFTTAVDFGFSKNPTETFEIWDKEQVIKDLVWIVRYWQPDIIVARFNKTPGVTHGHHTASAILADEVFELVGNKNKYPEILTPWQPKRVLFNASSWFFERDKSMNPSHFYKKDVGGFNSLLGTSYTEIAAASRSQHKSQGFGVLTTRGEEFDYFQATKGTLQTDDIFESIDLSWNRVNGGKEIEQKITSIIAAYEFQAPEKSVPALVELYQAIGKLDASASRLIQRKQQQVADLIQQCLGLYVAVYSSKNLFAPGTEAPLHYEIINRSGLWVSSITISIPATSQHEDFSKTFSLNNKQLETGKLTSLKIKEDAPFSNPLWLNLNENVNKENLYSAKLFTDFAYTAVLKIKDVEIPLACIMSEKTHDPVRGEVHQPLVVAPSVSIQSAQKTVICNQQASKQFPLLITAFKDQLSVELDAEKNTDWDVQFSAQQLSFQKAGDEQTVFVTITPKTALAKGTIRFIAKEKNRSYGVSLNKIQYDHIPHLIYFTEARVKVENVNLQLSKKPIAYIEGAGDEVGFYLEQIGYPVTYLTPQDLNAANLASYQAVILGIRAYNTIPNIEQLQKKLLSYVESGGNVIVQYITTAGLQTKNIGPYPFSISRERVTEENAPVVYQKNDALMQFPNAISDKDFEGWVQERGLYFAENWDKNYRTVFRMNDKGEKPHEGSLIVANYGKGTFTYTGISFFRQLPAGTTGAYKLLVNLIEQENRTK